ncbi:MAG: LysR substrate-binding domain-containing protein [Burkholderiales bacterium]
MAFVERVARDDESARAKARARLTLQSLRPGIQAAIAGQGLALGRFPLVKSLIDEGRLAAPLRDGRYASLGQDRAYWLIVSASAENRPEVKTFVRWLRSEVTRSSANA